MKRLMVLLLAVIMCVQPAHARSLFATVGDIVEARAKASDSDKAAAREMRRVAGQAAQRGNWSGAYKGYAEAALRWPDGDALLGMTQSLARMDRSADGCENGFRVKLSDLSRALRLLVLIQQIGEVDGQTYSAREARAAIAEALRNVFAEIDACAKD